MSSAGDDLAPLNKVLADLLAAKRATAGLTQKQLAHAVNYGRTTVATAESGHRQPAVEFWTACDKVLNADGDLTRAYEQLVAARQRRTEQRVQAERSRRSVRPEANSPAVAGIRHGIATGNSGGAGSALAASTTDLSVLPDQPAVRWIGSAVLGAIPAEPAAPALVADDLRQISAEITRAGRCLESEVVVHFREVLQNCKVDDGALGPRRVISTVLGVLAAVESTAGDALPTVRSALFAIGAEAAEFAGFVYRDLGAPQLAAHWHDRALLWARDGGDRQMEGYVLLRKSQSAWDDRDPRLMLSLADAADARRRDLSFRVQAEVVQQQARALAMVSTDVATVEKRLDIAWELLSKEDDSPDLNGSRQESVFQAQAALCFTELGQATRAVELLTAALDGNTFSYRDRGYFGSQLALAHAAGGDPEEAATVALRAVPIARATASVRTQRELRRLALRINRVSGEAVEELRREVAVGF